jgi:hypothetical protein
MPKHELDPAVPVSVSLLPAEWDALLLGDGYTHLRAQAFTKAWKQMRKVLKEQIVAIEDKSNESRNEHFGSGDMERQEAARLRGEPYLERHDNE